MSDSVSLAAHKNKLRAELGTRASGERSGWEGTLTAHEVWHAHDRVAAFVGVRHEPLTLDFLQLALDAGKRVFVPTMAPDKSLRMARLWSVDGLQKAGFGLREPPLPATDELLALGQGARALVLVPGLAFDRKGVRLGHGRGHYDRWFGRAAGLALTCIGLCTVGRVLDELPSGQFDRPMDGLLTPEGWALEPAGASATS